jgi:hypothetical protein
LALAATGLPGGAAAVSYTLSGTVTQTIKLDPTAPDFDGETGSGSFGFDSGLIDGHGDEVVTGDDLKIDFNIFGQSFTQQDDLFFDVFGGYPALHLSDGKPRALDFAVSELSGQGFNEVPLLKPFLAQFSISPNLDLVALGPDSFGASVTAVSQIPLPTALPLALGGVAALGLLGLSRRRAGG